MTQIILFNKPYDVLCQFTDAEGRKNLSDFIKVPGVYAAGRLDKDSEGLVLLTDDGNLQNRISNPKFKSWKTYWVQVEGILDDGAVAALTKGIQLKDGITRPARAKIIKEPENIWARDPPVRFRANIPTSWLELSICEGKNRQVRRMTAACGFPTLRLIRYSIGPYTIDELPPGEYKSVKSRL